MMKEVSFLNPEFFWLFLLLPAAIAWQFWKGKQSATLKISSVRGFKAQKSLAAKLKPYLFVLRLLALSSLIIAMARPRKVDISSLTFYKMNWHRILRIWFNNQLNIVFCWRTNTFFDSINT